jgi:hypothetical protein
MYGKHRKPFTTNSGANSQSTYPAPQLNNPILPQESCGVVSVDSDDSETDYPDIDVLPSMPMLSDREETVLEVDVMPTFNHEDSDFPDIDDLPPGFIHEQDTAFPDIETLPPLGDVFPDVDALPPTNLPPESFAAPPPASPQNEPTLHIMPSLNQLQDSRVALRNAALTTAACKFRCNKFECQMDANEAGRPRLRRQQVV